MTTQSSPPPVVLTIAGSDSSAGAGLQADLKTFAAHEVFGVCAATAVVAETPGRVTAWEAVDPTLLRRQLDTVESGFPLAAIKTGMLATASSVEVVGDFLEARRERRVPLVIDPVMVASSGDRLLDEEAIAGYRERLLPLATVATPNLAETAVLLDQALDEVAGFGWGEMEAAAREFTDRHGCPVLIKGGHWQADDGDEAVDLLWDGERSHRFATPRVEGVETHGTGCTLAAAIAANLARGLELPEAVAAAKCYLTAAIEQAHEWKKPAPIRALNHFPKAVG